MHIEEVMGIINSIEVCLWHVQTIKPLGPEYSNILKTQTDFNLGGGVFFWPPNIRIF